MRYGSQEQENVWTDVASSLVAAAAGYGFASVAKLGGNPLFPLLGQAGAGVLGVGLKHLTQNPYAHESLEALGYAGFAGVGWWAGETTTTVGPRPAGAPPFWHPGSSTSTSTSGSGAASAAAARAMEALRARRAQAGAQTSLIMTNRGGAASAGGGDNSGGYAYEAAMNTDSALS